MLALLRAAGVLDAAEELSHHSSSVSGTSVDTSKHEAELGTKGLCNGLLGGCANTQHRPSCSLQKERMHSSYEPREETSALLTSGWQRV